MKINFFVKTGCGLDALLLLLAIGVVLHRTDHLGALLALTLFAVGWVILLFGGPLVDVAISLFPAKDNGRVMEFVNDGPEFD